MFVLHDSSGSKKRRRPPSEEPAPAAKKQKAATEGGRGCGHRPPRFWDTLSKIRLSRGAVREFDRRTSETRQRQRLSAPSTIPTLPARHRPLQRFSRHGGPDLAHLRGFANLPCPNDTMSRASSKSHKRSSTTGRSDVTGTTRSSPYNGDFEQKLIDGGVYPPYYEHSDGMFVKPANIDDIQRRMREPRPSLSPSRFSEGAFEEFQRENARTAKEGGAMADVIPIIAGKGRKKYCSVTDPQFTNMAPIVEDVTAPTPDIYDGVRPERIDPRVRHSLSAHIVPSKTTSEPAAPNFFFEGKGPSGRADVAKRQACHDGAVGARAMHSLQNYGRSEPQYDGNAYTYSSSFHDGQLKLYGHHPTAPQAPGERPEYHMSQIKSYAMTSDRETFQKGATAFRNLRDHAGSHRDAFIEEANRVARHAPVPSPSTTFTESGGSRSVRHEDQSDTSADELAAEELTAKRHRHGVGQGYRMNAVKAPKPSATSRHSAVGKPDGPKRRSKSS